jgi:hypothetical protein
MVDTEQVDAIIKRIIGLWPVAKNNAEYQQTVREMLVAKHEVIQPDDLTAGFRVLAANTRMSRDDGGPAFPPSPGEVLGCVLTAGRNRAKPKELPRMGLRSVRGQVCRKCMGPLNFLPGDNVLHCPGCNTVMGSGEGIRLSWSEVQRLDFADDATISDEEVEQAKAKTMEALSRMRRR